MTDPIRLDLHPDGTAILTFNRPEVHNALTVEAMHAFARAVAELHTRPDLRAVIVTGAGEAAFCSGGDLADLAGRTSADEARAMTALMGDALLSLERLPVPVIAAINGYALGGGSEIALACDLRVVDAAVNMGFVQVKRGLMPGWGGGQRLIRLVGYSRALELLLTARRLFLDDLVALGLVAGTAPQGQALPVALDLARQIAAHDPAAVRAVKALALAALTQPYEVALHAERALFPPLWTGAAHQAAMQQFLARRAGGS
ncbi:MAG: enoyl-CoA hydratase/isomerase family protein [Candidatus Flexifilum sp.]|jgi:enoyl-CoA hydratase